MTNPPYVASGAGRDRAAAHTRSLQLFFEHEGMGKSAATRARYRRVSGQLAYFLDVAEFASSLGTGPATQLARQRQLDKSGAFFQVFGMEELVCCLPHFLDFDWLLPTAQDARTQISVVDRLLRCVRGDRLVDMQIVGCAWLEAESAVRQARANLRYASRTPSVDPAPRLRLIQGGQSQ